MNKLFKRLAFIFVLVALPLQVFAQNSVKGSVIDTEGEPMVGVFVYLESDQSVGTTTDLDGNFELSVPDNASLGFSFIGYEKKIVAVNGKSSLRVVLKSSQNELDDVVVVGYGVQKKVNLSGSVASVSQKELEDRPLSNFATALQGVVANLNISTSARPGSTSSMNIRGAASINSSSGAGYAEEPLILVDNVSITSEQFGNLNPSDIESISVIKDASAAAIYGARAAFGVILVTTKNGHSDKFSVSANYNYSYRDLIRLPNFSLDPYIQATYKDIMGSPWYDQFNDEEIAYAKKVSEDPEHYPAAIESTKNQGEWQYFGSTDWNRLVFKPSGTHTFNVNMSQATEKLKYFVSGEFLSQNGAIRLGNEIYHRFNFRSKVDYNITDWLSFLTNVSYTYDYYDTPEYCKTNGDGLMYGINKTNRMFVPYNPDGTYTYYGADVIGHLKDGGRHTSTKSNINLLFSLKADIIKDVWDVNADFTWRQIDGRYHDNEHTIWMGAGPDNPKVALDGGIDPWVEESHDVNKFQAINVYSNFHKTWNRHNFSALAGFNQEMNKYDFFWAKRNGVISPALPHLNIAAGSNPQVGGSATDWAVRGAFLRLNYNFDNRYIVEVNGRYDGSSRFSHDTRFEFFPSVSAAYVISNEKFFKPLTNVINHLKLRASYGKLGNQNVGAYSYIPVLGTGTIDQVISGQKPIGTSEPSLISSDLTWEKVSTLNFGLDMNLFNNKIVSSFDIFRRDTKDMLVAGATLPSVLGKRSPRINGANMKTTGWELTVSYRDQFMLANDPFNFGVKLSIADSRSFITKFDNPKHNMNDWYEGAEVGEIWGFHTAGFFKDQAEIDALDQSDVTGNSHVLSIEPGDIKFVDMDNNKRIDMGSWTLEDHGDLSIIGNSAPRLPYSFGFDFDWKGFDMSFFFQGIGKRDFYPPHWQIAFWGIYSSPWCNVLESNLDHWTPENPDGYFPRLKPYTAESRWYDLGAIQTKYMQDASYLRLKNFTFGYTIPEKLTHKLGLNKIRVAFVGENLATFTKLSKNIDPENLTGDAYPINRTFSFNLNLTF